MDKKVLIVGGVAGGATTAARLRRLDENVQIIIFERGAYISYANCGLPYYIGGTIKDRDDLMVQTPEAMQTRFNMDIRTENEVIAIDPERKTVTVLDIKTSTKYEESYDELVLSTGSTPIKPPIPGIKSNNIFSLWNIPDTDRIKSYVTEHDIKKATVIGGGFIGIEMVENLHDLGIEVTLVEMADQVMAPLDFELAQLVHSHLSSMGVHLYLKNGVKEFRYDKGVTTVSLQDGTQIDADMVILSIGISPNSELAKSAGLEVNARGGIVVDQHLRTSVSSIYALGDVIEVDDYVTNHKTMIPLAGPANKQGRIVADNICGRDAIYEGSQGTSVAKIFDLTVATTGINEKSLISAGKKYGIDYRMTIIQPKSHAGYYPGSFPMTLKVIFDLDGKILGAQNVGVDGIEKRIDVIASVMRFGATVYDLQRLELAYAPPYSSAKDPVNMIGYAAENILNKDQDVFLWRDIDTLDLSQNILLDVREDIEVDLGIIEGALHIPINDLRDQLHMLSKDKTIVVYCAVGVRGYIASRILQQAGYKVKNLIGGYNLYKYFGKDYTNPNCVLEYKDQPLNDDGAPEKHINTTITSSKLTDAILLDACGLQCPGPIMKLNQTMTELTDGDILKVTATDPGFVVDAKAWCKKTGNTFIKSDKEDKVYVAYVAKGGIKLNKSGSAGGNGSTMVIFSGDLDKALASMIIANGAAAMGKDVTLFFTFWGLNILRKHDKVQVKKSFIETMFGKMMPRGTHKLKLSQMNMGGLGTSLMHHVMASKNVNTMDELIASAMASGVKFVACTMSMDIMGIKEEELIDGVEYGGVAAYLGATEESNHNLFI
jgi:NADPH-dependent 2,4-dienoyl-CoA reductase/sulfur reductase-like enzyme/peroxiredoxin family protein/TusA-related sulfurtransferase/rhodanese-related sulfurtransferase